MIISLLGLVGLQPTAAGAVSNTGTEFWAVDLHNIEGGAGDVFAVVVVNNGTSAADVTVSDATSTVATANVAAGTLHTFSLPRRMLNATQQTTNGVYRISSPQPTVAYQFDPLANKYTNDASLLLPTTTLGTQYLVMAREQSYAPTFAAVVATQPGDTAVTVLTKADTAAGTGIPAMAAGSTTTRTLHQFEVFNLETAAQGQDLTGSAISADKKVAVFGGSACSFIPANSFACDHLEEQIFPASTWGKSLPLCHSPIRGTAVDVVRVLAQQADTLVTLPDATQVTLGAGEFKEVSVAGDSQITATKPILVSQFLVSQNAGAGIGDPSMLLAVPSEQFRTTYTFLTPDTFASDYLVVTAPKGATVNLDGTAIPTAAFHDLGTTGLACGTVKVADGAHTVQSAQKVGIAIYGYDNYASYAYPGGLELAEIAVCERGFKVLNDTPLAGVASKTIKTSILPVLTGVNPDVSKTVGQLNCDVVARVAEQQLVDPITDGLGPLPALPALPHVGANAAGPLRR